MAAGAFGKVQLDSPVLAVSSNRLPRVWSSTLNCRLGLRVSRLSCNVLPAATGTV